jgi:hypothetical protein
MIASYPLIAVTLALNLEPDDRTSLISMRQRAIDFARGFYYQLKCPLPRHEALFSYRQL